jgi:hypothetical protein
VTDISLRDDEVMVDERLLDLPTAITTLTRHLETAIGGMSPDLISIELNCDRGSARLKFYAHRHTPATGGP